MGLITRYISQLVVMRFAVVLAGLVIFLVSLDLMVSAADVVDERGDSWAVADYAVHKIPEIAAGLTRFAGLLGGLLAFTALIRRNELAPIWGSGISQLGLMLRLVPAALLFGVVQFVFDDVLVPPANAELRAWNLHGDYVAAPGAAAWLYVGNDVVRVPFETIGAAAVHGMSVFERDPEGNLTARLDAESATYDGDGWVLRDVIRHGIGDDVERLAQVQWRGAVDPRDFVMLTTRPQDMSLATLVDFVVRDRRGYWLPHYYATWLNVKIAALFTPALMLFLIVALAQRYQRTGHVEWLFFGGIAYGFGFFIFNGIAVAMGESGILPPIFAGWVPIVAMALVIAAIALWREVYESPGQTSLPPAP